MKEVHIRQSESENPIDKMLAKYDETKAESGVLDALMELQISLRNFDHMDTPGKVGMLRSKANTEIIQLTPKDKSGKNLPIEDPSNAKLIKDLKERIEFYNKVEDTHYSDEEKRKQEVSNSRQQKREQNRLGIRKKK
jgi:hypothetical protein